MADRAVLDQRVEVQFSRGQKALVARVAARQLTTVAAYVRAAAVLKAMQDDKKAAK